MASTILKPVQAIFAQAIIPSLDENTHKVCINRKLKSNSHTFILMISCICYTICIYVYINIHTNIYINIYLHIYICFYRKSFPVSNKYKANVLFVLGVPATTSSLSSFITYILNFLRVEIDFLRIKGRQYKKWCFGCFIDFTTKQKVNSITK